jgi:hypothetical protein
MCTLWAFQILRIERASFWRGGISGVGSRRGREVKTRTLHTSKGSAPPASFSRALVDSGVARRDRPSAFAFGRLLNRFSHLFQTNLTTLYPMKNARYGIVKLILWGFKEIQNLSSLFVLNCRPPIKKDRECIDSIYYCVGPKVVGVVSKNIASLVGVIFPLLTSLCIRF